jgi:hypothetical protein
MLDFLGSVVLAAAVIINIYAVASALDVSAWARLIFAAVAGVWVGLQTALYDAGAFQSPVTQTFPLIGPMVVIPPLAVAVAAIFSERVRAILLALPMQLLIGLNTMRLFGGFFVLLAAAGRLSGPFPYSAGWGDVIVGLAAIPLAIRVASGGASPATILAWNTFGALDLIAAVTLGTVSSGGFALQVFTGSPGSAAVQHMPWLLIPTALVPFYLITHGIVFAQLRAGRSSDTRKAAAPG